MSCFRLPTLNSQSSKLSQATVQLAILSANSQNFVTTHMEKGISVASKPQKTFHALKLTSNVRSRLSFFLSLEMVGAVKASCWAGCSAAAACSGGRADWGTQGYTWQRQQP